MKTTTVKLTQKTQSGKDAFNKATYTEQIIDVDGCLIGKPSSDDITNAMAMYGKKIAYVIGIPKGDSHNWVDTEVEFWGEKYRTIGYPETGEQANIPLKWGKNVKVERYG